MVANEISKRKWPIKSIITTVIGGYIIGVILIVWFVYEQQREVLNTRRWSYVICCLCLGLFGLILSYSRGVRCTITLAIPILCSSKGRSLVIAFAFILAATGPTMNTFDNVNVLAKSITCGQAQLEGALGQMLEVMKQPLIAIKNAIGTAMAEIQRVIQEVEVVLSRIQELVVVILASIKNAFDWLGNIVSVCNKEFGTPFDRCMKIANEAMDDCRSKLGPMQALCHATKLFSMLCYSVKFIDVICVMVVFFSDAIIQTVLERLKQFTTDIKDMFKVSVTFDHDFYFKTNATKDLSEVGADIMIDMHSRMKSLSLVFGWLDLIGSFLFFTIILKALYFKFKYVRNMEYNNKYITADFIAINEVRKVSNQEQVLPLTSSERKKYVQIKDWRLTRSELMKLGRSMLFVTITCVQLFCICFTDYSLYWLLSMISYYGHQQEAKMEVPPFIRVDVKGGGFVGEIFKGIAQAFEPFSNNYTIDATQCLPMPAEPNFGRYLEIAGLGFLAWVLLIFQPYGLRLRHYVMRMYYPEVAHERALWLYNQILMKRMNFFKFARRKARAKFLNDHLVDDFSFLDWLRAKTNRFWIFRFVLGRGENEFCIICSKPLGDDKMACDTLGCKAVYCDLCYNESNRTCCVCKNPIDYGDLSDISEAKDSSDELCEVDVSSI